MKIIKPSVELVSITPNAVGVIERTGRICYASESREGSADAFIRDKVKRGHGSVIEQGDATVLIVCDRGISHELVRHRLSSPLQESTRYCNYSKDRFDRQISVIEPPGLAFGDRVYWVNSCLDAEHAYIGMTDGGCKPEIARSVLPTCLATKLAIKANFWEWRHIIAKRAAPDAHPQVRPIAVSIHRLLCKECPAAFDDMTVIGPGLEDM